MWVWDDADEDKQSVGSPKFDFNVRLCRCLCSGICLLHLLHLFVVHKVFKGLKNEFSLRSVVYQSGYERKVTADSLNKHFKCCEHHKLNHRFKVEAEIFRDKQTLWFLGEPAFKLEVCLFFFFLKPPPRWKHHKLVKQAHPKFERYLSPELSACNSRSWQ